MARRNRRLCGKTTTTGGRCRNLAASCTANHPEQAAPDAAASIAVAREAVSDDFSHMRIGYAEQSPAAAPKATHGAADLPRIEPSLTAGAAHIDNVNYAEMSADHPNAGELLGRWVRNNQGSPLRVGQSVMRDKHGRVIGNDLLGHGFVEGASEHLKNATRAASDPEASAELLEGVCLCVSVWAHELESSGSGFDRREPTADLRQARRALECVAAHPNATDRAARQAQIAS